MLSNNEAPIRNVPESNILLRKGEQCYKFLQAFLYVTQSEMKSVSTKKRVRGPSVKYRLGKFKAPAVSHFQKESIHL